MLDAARIRADFPLLERQEHGRRLVYLDNAATTQKPEAVLTAIADYYRTTNANVHRGAYDLAIRATEAYEAARVTLATFVHAWAPEGVVFTRGTTEALNLVAGSYGRANVRAGDTVVVTAMDHHSNLVPWQMLCQEKGATLRMVEITEDGRLDLADFGRALERRPKIVAFPYVSNSLGTVNPAAALAKLVHAVGGVVVVDGAQSTPHLKVDVQELDCDFYALSGHKMLGPMGSGALVAKPGPTSRGRWVSPPRSPTSSACAPSGSRSTSGRSPRPRLTSSPRSTVSRSTVRATTGRVSCRSPTATSTRTTSPPSSTRTASAFAPGTTAPSR